jgi:hypothetical protein
MSIFGGPSDGVEDEGSEEEDISAATRSGRNNPIRTAMREDAAREVAVHALPSNSARGAEPPNDPAVVREYATQLSQQRGLLDDALKG